MVATSTAWCRLAFLVCGVLPTAVTAACVAWSQSPLALEQTRAVWQARIAGQLGTAVEIDQVESQRGGAVWLSGVRLFDPETKSPIATVRLVEILPAAGELRIHLSQPELDGPQLAAFCRLAHDRLLRGVADSGGTVQVRATELTIVATDRPQTVRDLQIEFTATSADAGLRAEFALAGRPDQNAITLAVTRNRQLTPPTTRVQIDTGGATLPCWLATDLLPSLRCLGQECEFQGSADLTLESDGWTGSVDGKIENVDLGELVTRRFPHKLEGLAAVSLVDCQFNRGKLLALRGVVRSPGGVISRRLIESAAAAWLLETSPRPRPDKPLAAYEQLAFEFDLRQDLLSVRGRCADAPANALLTDADGPILSTPRTAHDTALVASVAMSELLVPHSEFQVSATRQTESLLRCLALPDLAPPTDGPPRAPSASMRLRDGSHRR